MKMKNTHKLLIFVLFYNAVMIYVSSFYHAAIFDPWQFLFVFLLFGAGPASIFFTIAIPIKLVLEDDFKFYSIIPSLLCIASVIIWSFGFWKIGSYFRPKLFQLVAAKNEQIVLDAIRNIEDPNEQVSVSGFRYPFCRMHTFGRYRNGALFLIVPSAPGPKDSIIYDPNDVAQKEDCEHLSGPWYYRYNPEF